MQKPDLNVDNVFVGGILAVQLIGKIFCEVNRKRLEIRYYFSNIVKKTV